MEPRLTVSVHLIQSHTVLMLAGSVRTKFMSGYCQEMWFDTVRFLEKNGEDFVVVS